ncbi:WcaF family extracellular polysaccharide biosynthesis acetyltransferase [Agarivorans sp. MS3-6]
MYQLLDKFPSPASMRGRKAIVVQLWWLIQSTLFGLSPQFMFAWRRCLLRAFGASVGQHVKVRPSARITYPWKLTLGDHAWVGDDVVLYNWSEITIDSHAVVSQRSYLCTGTHLYDDPKFTLVSAPIHVKSQAWVATDCFISPGVTIGEGAVIGARSSVFKDMPDGMICAGSPAKPVKPRLMKGHG